MKKTLPPSPVEPLDHSACWRALVARGRRTTTPFLYGVRTTGIFCRPGCTSRLPNRENVVFFGSPAEALAAGFRPCKRCQPDGATATAELDARIVQACRRLQKAEHDIPLPVLARTVGVSPYHFHRLFKGRLGVTPKQYQSANRTNRFKAELRRHARVGTAVYAAGFGSSSRAYENISRKLGMSPRQYQKGGKGLALTFALERTSLGWILLAAGDRGVCAIELGDNPNELRRRLKARFSEASIREDKALLGDEIGRLVRSLATPEAGLSLPLDIRGTAFQQRVWAALQQIPPGRTASYGTIARRIGAPRAARAVARACATNPIALAIPCHRVVREDGSLGGYRWGLDRKRALLEQEKTRRPGF
jgi:AraC family transcriptional regulator of adaptative response/methylated-DNA-[protein]-cysteine methyltransferase